MAIKWKKNDLIRDFKGNRCILLLGPKLATFEKDGVKITIEEGVASHIVSYLDDYNISYDESFKHHMAYVAQRFMTIPGIRSVDLEDVVTDFIEDHAQGVPAVYHEIAKLPILLAINTTPDEYLASALLKKGKQSISSYYHFQNTKDNPQAVPESHFDPLNLTIQAPWVFNLFGTYQKPESLVLTQNHHLDFVRNVVKDSPKLPDELLSHFDRRKTYLFLGFDMDNWQYGLLLDSLKLLPSNTTLSPRMANEEPLPAVTRELLASRFNFHFIDQDVEEFVGEINTLLRMETEQEHQHLYIISTETDDSFRDELCRHLAPLEREGNITIRHRGQVGLSDNEDQQASEWIAKADVVLIITTAELLADSKYAQADLKLAETRYEHNNHELSMYPVLAKACHWREDSRLSKLIPLPRNGRPITDNTVWGSRDAAYQEIVEQLKTRMRK